MLQEWIEKYYIVYALIILCGVGLLIKLITNFVYIRLVRASGNMSSSKNKLVKQMKLKFETFYKLKIGVNNVDIFVDKYVYKYKICGFLLSTWENISGLMLMLCLLIAPIASILGLIYECGEKKILYTFFSGICTSAVLIVVDNLFNIASKRQIIKLNIKDYLENYLKVRLEQEAENPEAFEQYRTELASSLEKNMNSRKVKKEIKRQEKERLEREKYLLLEAKQKERELRKKDKLDRKEAEIARKEEERRRNEEERRKRSEEKARMRRMAIEERKEEERQRLLEKQQEEERIRKVAEEKAALKRQENARKLAAKQEIIESKQKAASEAKKANCQVVKVSEGNESGAKVSKKKMTVKQAKMQERNERLKEEIQAQREQRMKDRLEGKDPFETFSGSKRIDQPKEYKVNDFNMEYEMRVKAAQREEAKRKDLKDSISQGKLEQNSVPIEQFAATVATKPKKEVVRGNSPYEDKVIDDILKEFLA